MSNQFTPPDTEANKLEVIKTLAKKWDFKTDKKVVEEWRRLCAAYDSSATRLEAVSAARVATEYGELKDRSIEHVVEGKPELIASKAESKASLREAMRKESHLLKSGLSEITSRAVRLVEPEVKRLIVHGRAHLEKLQEAEARTHEDWHITYAPSRLCLAIGDALEFLAIYLPDPTTGQRSNPKNFMPWL